MTYVVLIAISANFPQYTPLMWFSKKPSFFNASSDKRIYLDYASAPPVLPEAVVAMREAEMLVGNPGAIHSEAVAAKKSLENSRARIVSLLGCKARELLFTSGLTEANNLAIVGYAKYLERTKRSLKGTHWLVSSIEHDSVLASFAEVERVGGGVSYVEPNGNGIVTPEAVSTMVRKETVFVSVGWANNEIGTVQPLGKIAQKIRQSHPDIVFHSDAGQAPLYLPTLVHSLGVDLLALGSNKLYGPHGIGALYIEKNATLARLLFGGKQERGLRPGTESVALAAGFAAAYGIVAREREGEAKRLKELRDELARQLVTRVPGLIVNGDLKHALPHMLNISIPHTLPTGRQVSSEYVTLALDAKGIAVSTKSACREGEESRSHVVLALGDAKSASSSVALAKEERAQNTIRISLGRESNATDLHRVVKEITRALSLPG